MARKFRISKKYYLFDPKIRKVMDALKDDEMFNKYINGQIQHDSFQEYLFFTARDDLRSKGIDDKLAGYFFEKIMIMNEEDRRLAGHSQFTRFARRLGLDNATPQQKIDFVKNTDFNKFLDILSVSNGLLRNLLYFQRWKDIKEDRAVSSVSAFSLYGASLMPPDNSRFLLGEIYINMQQRISVNNMDYWAVVMYFAIVGSHIFADGNGRTARHAYYMLSSKSGILDEEHSRNRVNGISDLCEYYCKTAVLNLSMKYGTNNKLATYGLNFLEHNNETSYHGLFDIVFYIAFRDVMKRTYPKLWTNDIESAFSVGMTGMPRDVESNYKKKLNIILNEWFHEYISVVSKSWRDAKKKLDNMLVVV